MKNPPAGWPRITSALFYEDAASAIDWLCRAFGFEVRLKVEDDDGRVVHSELVFDDGLILLYDGVDVEKQEDEHLVSPRSADGRNTQCLTVYVDDVDAHCAHARASGAQVFREPAAEDHGAEYAMDRTYGARDLEGHIWFFVQRVRDPQSS